MYWVKQTDKKPEPELILQMYKNSNMSSSLSLRMQILDRM